MHEQERRTLTSYIDAGYPILYISHPDFHEVDDLLREVAQGRKIQEYVQGLGSVDFNTKAPLQPCDLADFLTHAISARPGPKPPQLLILKDVHRALDEPAVIAQLKSIAEKTLYRSDIYNTVVVIVSGQLHLPPELSSLITVVDIQPPEEDDIIAMIRDLERENEVTAPISPEDARELAISFKGMSTLDIRKLLDLAYQDGGSLQKSDARLILKHKEQMLRKDGLLELINIQEDINSLGGLNKLKDWLRRKARVFRDLGQAREQGVDVPKGILIAGMPGCGKSLAAKVTAEQFGVPLVRMDVGQMLGKYIGESEQNMRKALQLAEALSPCVLWIDELEKAFAGVGGVGGGSDVTTRLFGQFLTWMQEKNNTVFIVATSNDISNLPPEFLRKGRFDELFCVKLPNRQEREDILRIHLEKRRRMRSDLDLSKLAGMTAGYSGADLEAIVREAIESSFLERRALTTNDLLDAKREVNSIKQALGDRITKMQEEFKKFDLKPASAGRED